MREERWIWWERSVEFDERGAFPYNNKVFRIIRDVYIGSRIENLASKEVILYRRNKNDIIYRRKFRIIS